MLDLNGYAIYSKDGTLNMYGTVENKVTLIVGKAPLFERIEPEFKAQFVKVISSNDAAGISLSGNVIIEDSEVYGHIVMSTCSISNSRISKLYLQNEIRAEINNSTIYQIYNIGSGDNVSVKNNSIFMLELSDKNSHDVSLPNTNFIDNDISYLNISENSEIRQNTFKNNYISKLLINGYINSSFNQNNIGLLKNGFYEKNEEPFWQPSWGSGFKKINGPTVEVNTSGHFEVLEIDLSNNYWAPEILKEMKQKGPDQNISFIYDYHDDRSLDKVIYKDWSETEFN